MKATDCIVEINGKKVLRPERLWQLARLALDDLLAVERRGDVEIDMSYWVAPMRNKLLSREPVLDSVAIEKLKQEANGKCCACLAGSVLINSLSFDVEPMKDSSKACRLVEYGDIGFRFDRGTMSCCGAINALRTGDTKQALTYFNMRRLAEWEHGDFVIGELDAERQIEANEVMMSNDNGITMSDGRMPLPRYDIDRSRFVEEFNRYASLLERADL
jgi:hypothetical protein